MASSDYNLSPIGGKEDLNQTVRPWSPSVTRVNFNHDPNESLIRLDDHNETFIADDNIGALRLTTEGILRFLQDIKHEHGNQITALQRSIREVDEQLKTQNAHLALEVEKIHQAVGSNNLPFRLQGLQTEMLNTAKQSRLDVSQVIKEIRTSNDKHSASHNSLLHELQKILQPLLQENLSVKEEIATLRSELGSLRNQHLVDTVQTHQLVENMKTMLCEVKTEILESIKGSETRVHDELQIHSTHLTTLLSEVRHVSQNVTHSKDHLQTHIKSRSSPDENDRPVLPPQSTTSPSGTITALRGNYTQTIQVHRPCKDPANTATAPGVLRELSQNRLAQSSVLDTSVPGGRKPPLVSTPRSSAPVLNLKPPKVCTPRFARAPSPLP